MSACAWQQQLMVTMFALMSLPFELPPNLRLRSDWFDCHVTKNPTQHVICLQMSTESMEIASAMSTGKAHLVLVLPTVM